MWAAEKWATYWLTTCQTYSNCSIHGISLSRKTSMCPFYINVWKQKHLATSDISMFYGQIKTTATSGTPFIYIELSCGRWKVCTIQYIQFLFVLKMKYFSYLLFKLQLNRMYLFCDQKGSIDKQKSHVIIMWIMRIKKKRVEKIIM